MSEDETRNLENLEEAEFRDILDCTVEELLEKAWKEQWKVKHIDFWLKVKNAQTFEKLLNDMNAIRDYLDSIRPPEII